MAARPPPRISTPSIFILPPSGVIRPFKHFSVTDLPQPEVPIITNDSPDATRKSMPFLVLIGDVIGVFGGYIVGVLRLGFNPAIYLSRTLEYLEVSDVTLGLIKAAVFGFLIALMGCYHGYHSGRGAEGVGRATTNAVVSASILILISNYLVTALFFGV